MVNSKLYLIDATSFCYRAFYALKGLSTSSGIPTNAVYGFLNMLNKILKEEKPQYLGICFDVSRETFRQKKFKEYKIQRPPMPDELSAQIPLIKEIIRAYNLSLLEKEGFEADDIIATMSKRAASAGMDVVIVSSDKDMLQLVTPRVKVFSPYKDEGILYDEEKVHERFGLRPDQITEMMSLMGDDIDNIPGVRGIGEKTAVSLIKEFGSVANLLRHLEGVKSEKIRKLIQENTENIELSRELSVLSSDADIEFRVDELKVGEPDPKKLFLIFKRLEFKKFLKEFSGEEQGKPASVSVETIKDEDLALQRGEGFCFYGDSPEKIAFYRDGRVLKVSPPQASLQAVLEDEGSKKISHDLKKIKVNLRRNCGIDLKGFSFDTMLAAYLLNPSKANYGLTDLAWDYLGESAASENLTTEQALTLIVRLQTPLEKELHAKALSKLFSEVELPLANVLADMELEGIKIDREALSELSRVLEKRLIKLIGEIYELSGVEFNINSPKQLREILFTRLELPVVRRSKTGPSTDEEVLKALSDKHELPLLLLEYRQLTKLKNTYIDTLPEMIDKKSGRIHTSFNQAGTETGRLSSSNPNLQNIPIKTEEGRRIRQAVVAFNKESVLVSADYSQIELRILAHLSGDKNLIDAFKNDEDIHIATAALIYGLKEEEVTEELREASKRINFGIVYGLSAYGLSRDLGIPLPQAEEFIAAYFLRYPGVKDYIQKQIQHAREYGFVTTIAGRRRYIPEINDRNQGIRAFAERKAINTPIQGSASDLIKLAMLGIHHSIATKKFVSRMILQIHDELLFNVAKEELVVFSKLVRDRMENVLKLDVPVKVDIKKGRNWLEMEEVK